MEIFVHITIIQIFSVRLWEFHNLSVRIRAQIFRLYLGQGRLPPPHPGWASVKMSSEDKDERRRLQDIFKTSSSRRLFAGYLSIHLFTEACLCLYSTHILYLYSYLWKVLLSDFTTTEMESEIKVSLSF